jgi:hypothetical protein
VGIRLREDQTGDVALLGAVPAEVFELFAVECEEHMEAIERDALALDADPASRERLDSLFRGIHSIKGNTGVMLGCVKGAALTASHPLQLLRGVAHGLESLLDPYREANAGPAPEELIQTALETCDAIRSLLGSLTRNGAGGPVSPELLARLGVRSEPALSGPTGGQFAGGREEAFRNTTSQCVEMMAGCFERMEKGGAFAGFAYPFAVRGGPDWMAQHFFTGGLMPSGDLLLYFQDHFRIREHWRICGGHCQKTSEAWLARLDQRREEALALFCGCLWQGPGAPLAGPMAGLHGLCRVVWL